MNPSPPPRFVVWYASFVGKSVEVVRPATKALSDADATALCAEIEGRMGLPTVDPYRHGAGRLVDALLEL
jgi:uncharacterized NAD-dependent epimerase/dehydratase family protein